MTFKGEDKQNDDKIIRMTAVLVKLTKDGSRSHC